MRSKLFKKILNFKVFVGFVLIFLAFMTWFGFYLNSLYGQLQVSFNNEEQFIPTRIYSDLTEINPSQSRQWIENRLNRLGYRFISHSEAIEFILHPQGYPDYLLPFNHPQAQEMTRKDHQVRFLFQGKGLSAKLEKIFLNTTEVSDLYLEPELVATLSRGEGEKKEVRTSLQFHEIPASVWKSIIAIEDQHFLEHKGFDPRGMLRAIWVNLRTLSFAQGGSTLTQQLVKNLMVRRTKNIFRKVNELFLSLLLEARFDKEKILERYLNEVYLGQIGNLEIHGVAEGAKHFFGKNVDDLNIAEIALMAGLIRGPGFYSPYRHLDRAVERQKRVLQKMVETGQIVQEEAEEALLQPLRFAPPPLSSNKSPFFTDYVKAELLRLLKDKLTESEITQSGFKVYTTLDSELNSFAQKVVSQEIENLEQKFKVTEAERLEGALACVDHKKGYIRALIGGKNYSKSNFNRILNMKRQVGSTFKPIVYLTAFQKRTDSKGIPYGGGYLIDDSPWTLQFDHGKQSWTPKNYEKKHYRGWITLREALSNSVNTVTSRLGYEVGISNLIQTSKSLGIESELPAVPSLSLGVAELSPIEVLKMYSTLANRGEQDDLTVIRGITMTNGTGYARFVYQPKNVFDVASVDLLNDILQSVFKTGTARSAESMGFTTIAAGKTGTTSNYRDAWFAGFTPELTTVVWIGMDASNDKKVRPLLTGSNSALPMWVAFMKHLHQGDTLKPFPSSELLTEIPTDLYSGKRASSVCDINQVRLEKWIKGNEPQEITCESHRPPSKSLVTKD